MPQQLHCPAPPRILFHCTRASAQAQFFCTSCGFIWNSRSWSIQDVLSIQVLKIMITDSFSYKLARENCKVHISCSICTCYVFLGVLVLEEGPQWRSAPARKPSARLPRFASCTQQKNQRDVNACTHKGPWR